MATVSQVSLNADEWVVRCEFDITTAGAIAAVRGDGVTVAHPTTGTYTVTVDREYFFEVLHRHAEYNQATPTAAWAGITSIDVDGAGDGSGAVITVKTFDDNATPTAADLATGTVSVQVTFRRHPVRVTL